MKNLFNYLLVLTFLSCNWAPSNDKEILPAQTTAPEVSKESLQTGFSMAARFNKTKIEEELEEETSTFYIVIADTSTDYYALRNELLSLHNYLRIPIDTMGRSYDPVKKRISLPDNADDAIFAGDYLPRRFPSPSLSLEHLNFYQEKATEHTYALVAGIYESAISADSSVAAIKQRTGKGFYITADIFTGCIH